MTPSPWVVRWAELISPKGPVLDLACGSGRHACHLAGAGHAVEAVDRDLSLSEPVRGVPGITWLQADLETGSWRPRPRRYAAVVVTNYLHRPLLPSLVEALVNPGGVFIYETFARGQENYGRPRNPAYLLLPGELLEVVRGQLRVIAYEDLVQTGPVVARVQRICAVMP